MPGHLPRAGGPGGWPGPPCGAAGCLHRVGGVAAARPPGWALLTAATLSAHGTRTNSASPHCGAAHQDEVQFLWDYPEWEGARETWPPRLRDAATAISQFGPPDQRTGCLRKAGLFSLWLAHAVDRGLLGEFLYRLYGMYPAVLGARMAVCHGDQARHGDCLFPDQPCPRPLKPYP